MHITSEQRASMPPLTSYKTLFSRPSKHGASQMLQATPEGVTHTPTLTYQCLSMPCNTRHICMQGYCVPGCAEDVIGMTFYRYILTNVVSINGVELVSALGKKCLHMASHVEAPWVS